MTEMRIAAEIVAAENDKREAAHRSDYQALGEKLARSSIDIDKVTAKVADFFVAVPSWGSARVARALLASPDLASRGISSTSLMTAASSSN